MPPANTPGEEDDSKWVSRIVGLILRKLTPRLLTLVLIISVAFVALVLVFTIATGGNVEFGEGKLLRLVTSRVLEERLSTAQGEQVRLEGQVQKLLKELEKTRKQLPHPLSDDQRRLEQAIRDKWGTGIQVNVRPVGQTLMVELTNYRQSFREEIDKWIRSNQRAGQVSIKFYSPASPIVLIMDSPLPGNVYDPSTPRTGSTNADDIDIILRGPELGSVKLLRETTSRGWARYDHVKAVEPDLIIVHSSAFWDNTNDQKEREEFARFLKQMETIHTMFLVYSRSFKAKGYREDWVEEMLQKVPGIRGRLHTFFIKGFPEHFRTRGTNVNTSVTSDLQNEVKKILQIGSYPN